MSHGASNASSIQRQISRQRSFVWENLWREQTCVPTKETSFENVRDYEISRRYMKDSEPSHIVRSAERRMLLILRCSEAI